MLVETPYIYIVYTMKCQYTVSAETESIFIGIGAEIFFTETETFFFSKFFKIFQKS